jgi:hypothetical protein
MAADLAGLLALLQMKIYFDKSDVVAIIGQNNDRGAKDKTANHS